MFKSKFSILAAMFLCGAALFAQETKPADELKISLIGRFYLDGGMFIEDKTDLSNGATFSDLRLGLKAKYGKFSSTVDIGFSSNRVSAKDVFLQYDLGSSSYVRAGHFAEPFGIDVQESSSNIKFMMAANSAAAFSPSRKLGVEYIGWNKCIWVGGGLFADGDAIGNTNAGDDGFAVTGRFVFNPLQEDGKILHVGIAGSYRKADASGFASDGKENPKRISYSGPFLTSIEPRRALDANISDANYQAKYGVELIGAYGPVSLQAEYFNAGVARHHDLPYYHASGGYGQIGFLALGGNYNYSTYWARLGAPKPKSLEFVARYDYTTLDDKNSGIYGGRMSDWSLAANYYLTKNIMFRLNYSNMSLGKHNYLAADENVSLIQGRLQVVF